MLGVQYLFIYFLATILSQLPPFWGYCAGSAMPVGNTQNSPAGTVVSVCSPGVRLV